MKRKIRLMLVEDHPEYREVIELALRKEPDMELTSQFGTSERALLSMHNRQESEKPDLILLDLNLPGIGGLDSIPLFASAIPGAKIIILTQSDKESDVLRAITLGASGYLLKSSSCKQITEGIRLVAGGGATLDAGIARFILKALQTTLPKGEPEHLLSPREIEILSLLAQGLEKKEIAEKLIISTTTVITHVAHIYEKLKVTNAPSAIHQAHILGLLSSRK